MPLALKVENLSKAYRLGEIGTGTISQDIERWFALARGKEDPFLKIGETNDRGAKGNSNVVWSLRDINFEIEQGEAIGIIGPNGAGKSTLLKILSRITSPSSGRVLGNGRVASLLEVGTGFNPELTGRENIFLNGAILGMRRAEITRHFDEIVDFAGVERYIDTPVKRYSSGMYVRLAFAVAAYLESEILIVDEVLAVGDAEFQKKCLGKIGDVSQGEGRTVLFVSHTMSAIKQLCKRAILLNNGRLEMDGITKTVINQYLTFDNAVDTSQAILTPTTANEIAFKSVSIVNQNGEIQQYITNENDFYIQSEFVVTRPVDNIEISYCIRNSSGVNVLFTSLSDNSQGNMQNLKPGNFKTTARIRKNFLLPDNYKIDVYAHQRNVRNIDFHENVLKFTVVDLGTPMTPYGGAASDFCCVLENCDWDLSAANN